MSEPRLFVPDDLRGGVPVAASREQAHYLLRVLRLESGAPVLLFNGRDGEWRTRLAAARRNACTLVPQVQTRPQATGPDVWLLFAPLKRGPTDFLVQKATELGIAALRPVLTRRTVAERVNLDRLRAIAIEAAEQCERLDVPEIIEPVPLARMLSAWPAERQLMLCDESGGAPAAGALAAAGRGPWALLLGPEGGFAPGELDPVRDLPFVCRVGLGPRILRAETAALAALAVWQATLGDWTDPPPRRSDAVATGAASLQE